MIFDSRQFQTSSRSKSPGDRTAKEMGNICVERPKGNGAAYDAAYSESIRDQDREHLRLAKEASLSDLTPAERDARASENSSKREDRLKAAEARAAKNGGGAKKKKKPDAKKSSGLHLTGADFM